jgi:hypothetical protein
MMLDLKSPLVDLADERWAQVWEVDQGMIPYDAREYFSLVVSTLEKDISQSAQLRHEAAELLAHIALQRWMEASMLRSSGGTSKPSV